MADKKLNSITFPDLADRYILDAGKVQYDPTDTFADGTVGKALETKAEVDGYYEEMTVGDAEQLVATQYVENSEPYVYRTTGGTADVGNREYVDSIVGGTIAWNQMLDKSNYPASSGVFTNNGDGTITANGTPTETTSFILKSGVGLFQYNHVYLIYTGLTETGSSSQFEFMLGGFYGGGSNLNIYTGTRIAKCNRDLSAQSNVCQCVIRANYTADNIVFKPQIFDLTQMLGSTIADYILSIETAETGTGVSYFKSLFPKSLYDYNAVELLSVNTSEHKTVGFNQWDEEWEVGTISSSTGTDSVATDRIRSKNYIPVIGNAHYYFHNGSNLGSAFVFCYDADKNYLHAVATRAVDGTTTNVSNYEFVLAEGTAFIRFYVGTAYGTTYHNDICINLSWSGYRNGEYEPYESHSYPLDSSLTLRGVPKLDASNNMYYDGDTYEPDGTVTRKYGIVDLGTLTWSRQGGTEGQNYRFMATVSGASTGAIVFPICSKYVANSDPVYDRAKDKVVVLSSGNVFIEDNDYTDAQTFKTAMSGVYLVYKLATPTTETADAYQQIQICNDFGTEEYIDYSVSQSTREVSVPVGHNTRYPANLRDKLQHLPDLAENDGTYLITQANKQMSLTPYSAPTGLPTAPTTDGTYVLKCTVSDGSATYSWESEA